MFGLSVQKTHNWIWRSFIDRDVLLSIRSLKLSASSNAGNAVEEEKAINTISIFVLLQERL